MLSHTKSTYAITLWCKGVALVTLCPLLSGQLLNWHFLFEYNTRFLSLPIELKKFWFCKPKQKEVEVQFSRGSLAGDQNSSSNKEFCFSNLGLKNIFYKDNKLWWTRQEWVDSNLAYKDLLSGSILHEFWSWQFWWITTWLNTNIQHKSILHYSSIIFSYF